MRAFHTLCLVILALSATACAQRLQPLETLERPLPRRAIQELTLEEIGRCVRVAAERQDWLVLPDHEPGYTPVYRYMRNHELEVDLHYDSSDIRAEYSDSKNLLFDERGRLRLVSDSGRQVLYEGPVIHRAYSHEVLTLLRAIHTELRVQDGGC